MTPSTIRNKRVKSKKQKATATLCAVAFWLLVWHIASVAVGSEIILVSPLGVVRTLFDVVRDPAFLPPVGYSAVRIIGGFFIAMALGVVLGWVSSRFWIVETLLRPITAVIKATPVASIIILMLYVLGKSAVPMVASLLMVIPIVFVNVRRGIDSVPASEREVAQVYGFGFGKRLRYLTLPSVLPYFSAACRSALGLAWKAGVAAEVICTPKNSIGGKLYDAKIYLESEELYAWTIVVILLSVLIEKVFVLALDRLSRKGGVSGAEA